MTQSKTTTPKKKGPGPDRHGYEAYRDQIKERMAQHVPGRPLFWVATTGVFDLFLAHLPEEARQHYTCNACRKFFERYAGLVTIEQADGVTQSVLFGPREDVPAFFRKAHAAVRGLVNGGKAMGVFLSADKVLGTPVTGVWTHFHADNPRPFEDNLLTADQAEAARREDYKVLASSIGDYNPEVLAQAARLLDNDALCRSEKGQAVVKWLQDLQAQIKGKRGSTRSNLTWLAAAGNPAFCHVKNSVVGTLLDDLKAGLSFEVVKARWAEKLHPLQYQRPQAAPRAGQIDAAEKAVAALGIENSLRRRAGRLEDVLAFVWRPRPPAQDAPQGGTFAHLRGQDVKAGKPMDLPAQAVTWEKFTRVALPNAVSLEVSCQPHVPGPYYNLTTAADPTAPPILQSDGLPGQARNPCSYYVYHNGSYPKQWNLTKVWNNVTAVFLDPHHWQEPEKFKYHARVVMFAVEGARDTTEPDLALFPEDLRAELRPYRSTIEAHAKAKKLEAVEEGTAAGVMFYDKGQVLVRVTEADGGRAVYLIDRFD